MDEGSEAFMKRFSADDAENHSRNPWSEVLKRLFLEMLTDFRGTSNAVQTPC
jgi:hypothetical protein